MKLWNRHTVPSNITATYIGRGTQWGNRFKVGEEYTQDEAADAYRRLLSRNLAARNKKAMDAVIALADTDNISCSCTPKKCHGDCYVEIYDHIKAKGGQVMTGVRSWLKLHGFPGPDTDGKDHINMYTKAATKLGKKLTNLSNLPVHIDGVGQFMSLEGYWYFLSTGEKHLELLDMNGFEAKQFGKDKPRIFSDNFQDLIKIALWKRFEQNPTIKEMLIKSTLPFKHYYHYGNDDNTVTYPMFDWITNEIEFLRKLYKGELKTCIIAGSRDITDEQVVADAIKESGFEFDAVVNGTAKGVDTLGAAWGSENNKIVKNFHPDWDRLKKSAGYIRNKDMGDFCTYGIVIIKNNSKGSTQMAEYLKSLGKPVYVKHI